MDLTFSQLVALVHGQVLTGSEVHISGLNTLSLAGPGDLSFFGNERYLPQFRKTRASVVLVPPGFTEELEGVGLIAVESPSMGFAEVMKRLAPPPRCFRPGVHPSAMVDPTAVLNPGKVCIGPGAIIEAQAVIGDGTEIAGGAYVGRSVHIGKDCVLFPRATVLENCRIGNRVRLHAGTVIGGDGFGYEFQEGLHQKIDQLGIVRIDDDVEVGANSTIDRARFGQTWIGQGTKIDNLVQIGHNVVIGRHCIIVAQVGIAGSVKIGDYVVIAAQAGIAGHLEVGSQVVVSARGGVTKHLPDPGTYMGFPAMPARKMRAILVAERSLPELLNRVKALENRLPPSTQTPD